MTVDTLSDVLRAVRLTGATFFDVVARGSWVAEQPPRETIVSKILPGAEHLIAYHVVTEGRCFGNLVGESPLELQVGDVIVFTRGDPHVMASAPGMRSSVSAAAAYEAAARDRLPFPVNYGSGGPVTAKLVCGFLACDARPFNPLLGNLPPVIKSSRRSDGADWLSQFVALAAQESTDQRAGGASVLARLSELMFIEVLRRYLEALPPERAGWLAGLRDPFVGKALALMHGEAARSWTIEMLAKEVGLSRSVLAERFADLVGMPPMQYLANWRMQVAAGLLSSGATIATIAAEIGYGSEAAFSRAFKKIVGMPPSDWARRQPNQA